MTDGEKAIVEVLEKILATLEKQQKTLDWMSKAGERVAANLTFQSPRMKPAD